MAAKKKKANDLKAKEAKQKKILAGAGVLFVILMVIQVPKLTKHSGNVGAAPPIPVATTTAPVATDGTTATLAPPAIGSSGSTSTAGSSSALADTDVVPAPATGQLVQFDLFTSKDPFVQQVKAIRNGDSSSPPPADASSAATAPAAGGSGSGTGGFSAGNTPTAPAAPSADATPAVPMTSVARIVVNDSKEQLVADACFPEASPTFQLRSFTATAAEIAVLGGAYQSGAPSLKLEKGHTVTLMNTADGSKFRITYLGAAKVPTASLPAPAPTATAPATTTPATTTTAAPTTTTPPATTTTSTP